MAEPRDHILALAAQLRSDMTTLANVTAKVRVNGGAATTYTNVSTPAITQNADITYGYQVKIPANTYSDGDDVEVTWLYSATAAAYDAIVIGPAAVDGAHYTNARGDNLANLDTAISTRSTYAGTDTPGTTTLLARIAAALTITGGKVDVNDKTSFALTSAYDPAKTAAQAGDAMALTSGERTTLAAAIWGALTSGLTTTGSIGKFLSGIVASIWGEPLAGYTTPGTAGKDLATVGSSSDPWATSLPGAYTGSEAGAMLAAVEEKATLIGTGVVVYGGPVLSSSQVEIVQGDDYLAVDGRALEWTSSDWPDITGATVTLDIRQTVQPHATNTYPATVLSATAVEVELTSVQTAALAVGTWSFALDAILTNLSQVTLAEGVLVVLELP